MLVRICYAAVFARNSEAMELGLALMGTVLLVRTRLLIVDTLSASCAPERRATGLTETEASFVMRAALLMLTVTAVVTVTQDL